jgi:hypothetical protein
LNKNRYRQVPEYKKYVHFEEKREAPSLVKKYWRPDVKKYCA